MKRQLTYEEAVEIYNLKKLASEKGDRIAELKNKCKSLAGSNMKNSDLHKKYVAKLNDCISEYNTLVGKINSIRSRITVETLCEALFA